MTNFEPPTRPSAYQGWDNNAQQSGQYPLQNGQNWDIHPYQQQFYGPFTGPQQSFVNSPPPTDKSVGVAVLLTFMFGCFGLFYSSVVGGVVMTVVTLLTAVFSVLTLGVGALLFLVIWPVEMIWAAISASRKHSECLAWYAQHRYPYHG